MSCSMPLPAAAREVADPLDLLAARAPDTPFFCSSPSGQLLAGGALALLQPRGASEMVSQVRGMLDDLRRSRLGHAIVGAVPFDTRQSAVLRVPAWLRRAPAFAASACPRAPLAGSAVQRAEQPVPAAYCAGVRQALSRIEAGALRKVVLARALDVGFERPIDVAGLLERLRAGNPQGYTFAAELAASEGGVSPVLVGASPELLVSRRGRTVVTHPLAGTVARSSDPAEDHSRAQALLRSEKDRNEHAVVIEDVRRALQPLCENLQVPSEPSLLRTPNLWHLSTRITGEVADPSVHSLELALALHPTPAVCGLPVDDARSLIDQVEPVDRGFFAGAVGWCDVEGQGDWVLAIRCAEIHARRARLYAGAGIVAGSEPERELAETQAKLGTMLHALGASSPHE